MGALHQPAPRSIWAVGKNYAAHVRELGTILPGLDKPEKEPVIFLKSAGTLVTTPASPAQPIPLPLPVHWSRDVHHELELAIELGPDLQPARAAVSLDVTARDAQLKAKDAGLPWTLSKSFPASSPLGTVFDITGIDLSALALRLEVNGQLRQTAHTSDMLFDVPTITAYLRSRFPVEPGDLILTGTPDGVGPLVPGDLVEAWVMDAGGATKSNAGRVLSTGRWLCTAAVDGDAVEATPGPAGDAPGGSAS